MDTATTFKLGVFPFTNDPAQSNGNGVNGPCWSRDADNHQGYSTGPLAATVDDPPNAPGVQVVVERDLGRQQRDDDRPRATRAAATPRGQDPAGGAAGGGRPGRASGLNITPYDNDNTAAAGTTTLRHIDKSTRLAWSAFGSVQSDPYRWGHATLTGYTPPAGPPDDAAGRRTCRART